MTLDEASERECDRCGERRLCLWRVDPFIREVYPEEAPPPAWWCESCYDLRADDI